MDEREAEERAEQAPPPEQVEPTVEPMAPTVDPARESGEAEAEMPVEAPAEMDDQEKLTEPELVSVTPAPELEPATEVAAEKVTEESVEGVGAESEGATAATMTPAQEHRAAAAEGLRRGRLPQGEVPVEGGSEPAWYVIHCYSGYENKVRHNLEQRIETMGMKDRIFDVVIPTQEEIEVREGKRRTVERHIFPGYVLVNMTLSEESWYVVRNTPGVTGFVGMGNLPTPLRPEEVSQIIKRMESEAPAVKVSFKVGERVRIVDGPFNDFRGTVSDIDLERTKVRVMVSFFGRETPVELDFLQVEKA